MYKTQSWAVKGSQTAWTCPPSLPSSRELTAQPPHPGPRHRFRALRVPDSSPVCNAISFAAQRLCTTPLHRRNRQTLLPICLALCPLFQGPTTRTTNCHTHLFAGGVLVNHCKHAFLPSTQTFDPAALGYFSHGAMIGHEPRLIRITRSS